MTKKCSISKKKILFLRGKEMKKLIFLFLFTVVCCVNPAKAESEIDSHYFVGVKHEDPLPMFEIKNGSFKANLDMSFSIFRGILDHKFTNLNIAGPDEPEKVSVAISGTYKDDILAGSGTGVFVLKVPLEKDKWDMRPVTVNIEWKGRKVLDMNYQYFDVIQTLTATVPNYEEASQSEGCTGSCYKYNGTRDAEYSEIIALDILQTISKDDSMTFDGGYLITGKVRFDEKQIEKLVELNNRFWEVERLFYAGEMEQGLVYFKNSVNALTGFRKECKQIIKVKRSPAEKLLRDQTRLTRYEISLQEQIAMAIRNRDRTLQTIEEDKDQFSAKAVKSMLESFVRWQKSVPSAPVDILGRYSFATGLFDLPRSVADWQTSAINDPRILADRANTFKQLEIYEKFWADLNEKCVNEIKSLEKQGKVKGIKEISDLHAEMFLVFQFVQQFR
jgi:hypothetical protein